MLKSIEFSSEERRKIQSERAEVEDKLLGNIIRFDNGRELLVAGDMYPGIWLEHNQDNYFLADYCPEKAWESQQFFMENQFADGLIPFAFTVRPLEGFPPPRSHLQCIWPFTRCAFEIAQKSHRPLSDFEAIYRAGGRYDDWLAKNRDKSGMGLVEMYCEWDTGHDGSPRVTTDGIPHACPDFDAANMPDIPCMPLVSADLSAMFFGNRMALAELAEYLGKQDEAALWKQKAAKIKQRMREYLYDPEEQFYFDRGPQGFRKYRSEHITRLFLNEVCDQTEFETIFDRWFRQDGHGFAAPFPIPSIAIDDPAFSHGQKNSWGGNSQALTMLRAYFWSKRYGIQDEYRHWLFLWLKAHLDFNNNFPQEIDPMDGYPIGTGRDYTPALILFLLAEKELH